MTEWQDKYNPFNSDKVLIWREWLEGCAKLDFLPPVSVGIDPSSMCTLDCIWCNSADYNKKNNCVMTESHLLRIADFLATWGVKSAHIFGGGEPLMCKGLKAFLYRLKDHGIEAGLITNGILLDDEIIETILNTCRWVGISMDAATNATFMKVKNTKNKDLYFHVIRRFSHLCEAKKIEKSKCDICYKFLLHPVNAHEIYDAAFLARKIGVDDFQMRPVGCDNIENEYIQPVDFDPYLKSINVQMNKAQQLECETFHVYGVRHKFTNRMQKRIA